MERNCFEEMEIRIDLVSNYEELICSRTKESVRYCRYKKQLRGWYKVYVFKIKYGIEKEKKMTLQEKLEFLEEIMDVEEGTLEENTVLEEVEEWDSLSTLALIAEMKKEYGIRLGTETIKEFKTVSDICKCIPD